LVVLTSQIFAKGGCMPLVVGRYVGFFQWHSLVIFAADVVDELIKNGFFVSFETKVFLNFSVDRSFAVLHASDF
jgi:hypothetical protein